MGSLLRATLLTASLRRKERERTMKEKEKKRGIKQPPHTHISPCAAASDASKMAPWWPATFGLLGTEAALSFLSLSG